MVNSVFMYIHKLETGLHMHYRSLSAQLNVLTQSIYKINARMQILSNMWSLNLFFFKEHHCRVWKAKAEEVYWRFLHFLYYVQTEKWKRTFIGYLLRKRRRDNWKLHGCLIPTHGRISFWWSEIQWTQAVNTEIWVSGFDCYLISCASVTRNVAGISWTSN